MPTDAAVDEDRIAALAKALGHPARIRILRHLMSTSGCIGGDIVGAVGLAQSTVSEHLRILKAAGVIAGQIDGPRVCYALNPDALKAIAAFIGQIQHSQTDATCCA